MIPETNRELEAPAPRVWLAVLGLSNVLGSEPMVAWQWYQRLKSRGPVTVVTSAIFDQLGLIPSEAKPDMVFLDTEPDSEAEFAENHRKHLIRWWKMVRAYLKENAAAGDILLITAPAAIWMFPFISGLPIRRRDIFFGPVGYDLVPYPIARFGRLQLRNLGLGAAAMGWTLLAPVLPAHIAFRSPRDWYHASLGVGHDLLAFVPDFDLPPLQTDFSEPEGRAPVSVLYDNRPRKRFDESLMCAVDIARKEMRELIVIACSPQRMDQVKSVSSGLHLTFQERMPRDEFLAWMRRRKPWHVTLSASEACSATIVEVLMAGGRIVSHRIGGLSWLIDVASDIQTCKWHGAEILNYCWDESSLNRFSSVANEGYGSIMNRMLPAL